METLLARFIKGLSMSMSHTRTSHGPIAEAVLDKTGRNTVLNKVVAGVMLRDLLNDGD